MNKGSLFILFSSVLLTTGMTLLIILLLPHEGETNCAKKFINHSDSFVCVCNSTYCDTAPEIPQLDQAQVFVVTTTKANDRFKTKLMVFGDKLEEKNTDIKIDVSNTDQEIFGFGGAFTDAASINFWSLSPAARTYFIESYFSEQGIEYNIGRIPMASCDFSTRLYTYDDVVNDVELDFFKLAEEDLQLKIPFIKLALEATSRKFNFFASPWSAPAWMKTSGKLVGGKLKSDPDIREAWANYFAKFIKSYDEHGIRMWGVTAQNEPDIGLREDFPFQCMGYEPEEIADFVKNYLGPALENTDYSDVKIMIGDDQRFLLPDWAGRALNETGASRYVDGIGIHWYTDMIAPVTKLDATHDQFPDKFMFATEACSGSVPFLEPKVDLGSWERGQYYSKDIINNLNHHVIAWTDWNMALDMQGGPNWVKNFVDSPIIVNKNEDEFYKQPMFYHMGHFSKYIKEGSKRIVVENYDELETRQFKFTSVFDESRKLVTFVVINQSEETVSKVLHYKEKSLEIDVLPLSIQTYVWNSE